MSGRLGRRPRRCRPLGATPPAGGRCRTGPTGSVGRHRHGTATDIFVFGGSILAFGRGSLAQELSSDLGHPPRRSRRTVRQLCQRARSDDPTTGDLHLLAVAPDGNQTHVVVSSGALTRRSRVDPRRTERSRGSRDHGRPRRVRVATASSASRSRHRVADRLDRDRCRRRRARTGRRPGRRHRVVHAVTPSVERWTLNTSLLDLSTANVLDPTPRRFARTSDHLVDGTPAVALGDRRPNCRHP